MVNKYRVHDTQLYDDEVFLRTTTVTSGIKSQNKIGKALDKRNLDSKIVSRQSSDERKMINEIYADLNIDTLRTISEDDYALSKFISNNSSYLSGDYLNVFFVNLEVPKIDVLTKDDYESLNVLLTWGKNDLYVRPYLSQM